MTEAWRNRSGSGTADAVTSFLDSQSGKRVAALIDHRIGRKREASPVTRGAAVRSAVSQGALKLQERVFAAGGR